MNEKLAAILKLQPAVDGQPVTDQQIIDAVAALQSKIKALDQARQKIAADEALIVEKMSVGLSRDQAIAVIQRQRREDAANGAAAKSEFLNLAKIQ